MAGGVGSRFWPMSRASFPKQFHDILGTGRTLLQMTCDRLSKITDAERILVVTNQEYAGLVRDQLPELPADNVLEEPDRKNTAPCIAYAAHRVHSRDPEASLVIAPSDHLISKEEAFTDVLRIALRRASESDKLLTLGVKPHRPDTGYGYIQFTEGEAKDPQVKRVEKFTEKPALEEAKRFLERGDHYWNSGIFIWHVQSLIKALRTHLPELDSLFSQGAELYHSSGENDFVKKTYASCPDLSIDHGLMEKARNVEVVLADIGWSDLGTWGALYELMDKDSEGNAVNGKQVMLNDTQDSLVQVPDDKLVVLQGVKDLLVVESDDRLLICRKGDEQRIKTIVEEVKERFGPDQV